MFLKVVEYWFTACGFCFGLVCFSFFLLCKTTQILSAGLASRRDERGFQNFLKPISLVLILSWKTVPFLALEQWKYIHWLDCYMHCLPPKLVSGCLLLNGVVCTTDVLRGFLKRRKGNICEERRTWTLVCVPTARHLVMLENTTGGIQKNRDSAIIRTKAHLFALSPPFP